MISIVVGTNRKGNKTQIFAKKYQEILTELGQEVKYLSLEQIPMSAYLNENYDADGQTATISQFQDEYISAADKILFVMPEYNGGAPGILKLFLDALSTRNYGTNFKNKIIAMVGVSSGRGGCLRGIEHISGSIQHMGGYVFPNRIFISEIGKVLDENGVIVDEPTLKFMNEQAQAFASAILKS